MESATMIGLAWPVALLASFIFLLNPVSHEGVLWVSGRPVLSTWFQLLSALSPKTQSVHRFDAPRDLL
jgi:hypothetical protein